METEIRKSLGRVLHLAALHSRRFRLSSYRVEQMPDAFVDEVGAELVDLIEHRFETWEKQTPPKPGAPSAAGDGPQRPARARGQ